MSDPHIRTSSPTGRSGSSSASCRRRIRGSRSAGGSCCCCAACCRRSSRSRPACWSARCRRRQPDRCAPRHAADTGRRRLRPAADPDADSTGAQLQPRRSHGGLALRSADRGLRPAGRDGPSRGSVADQRPHGGARFRSRHDRSAAVLLDGLHRQRHGRDDRRSRVRRYCSSPTRGGRRSCSPARGSRRSGCCARARSGGIATRPRCAPRSATPTTPIAWPSIRRRPRSCACSASPAGPSRASSSGGRACTRSSTTRRGCARSR